MNRSIAILLVLIGTVLPVGCGGKADPEGASSATASNRSTPVSTGASTVPPNEIVAMFSDSIRRGDKETTIKLITLAAREEIQRRGMTIDPPGSPESSYKIGEVRFLDQDRDAAYVESIWIEPGTNGQPNVETEVVWAVQLEPEGWRISGLAIDMGPNEQPTLVDFENLEVDTKETSAGPMSNRVAGETGSNPSATMPQAPNGFQAPSDASVSSTSNTTTATPAPQQAPEATGFSMPTISAPQISQPPNAQFR
jgi:hypothetical protein